MDIFFSIVAVACGLILGSFFNVLIYRLPRKESVVWPGSHCPRCGGSIRPLENIPVISYLFLRGRCAGCKEPISVRYPIIELSTAIAAFLLYWRLIAPWGGAPSSPWRVATLALQLSVLFALIPISVIDITHFIIPDSITLPGLGVGIAASFFPGGMSPLNCLLGIAAGGGSLFVIGLLGEWILKKGEAMGGGDVKLMAFCGAVFGWKIALGSIMIAALLGSIIGIALLVFKVLPKDHRIQFGPFLACGLWVTVLFGKELMHLYQTLIEQSALI